MLPIEDAEDLQQPADWPRSASSRGWSSSPQARPASRAARTSSSC